MFSTGCDGLYLPASSIGFLSIGGKSFRFFRRFGFFMRSSGAKGTKPDTPRPAPETPVGFRRPSNCPVQKSSEESQLPDQEHVSSHASIPPLPRGEVQSRVSPREQANPLSTAPSQSSSAPLQASGGGTHSGRMMQSMQGRRPSVSQEVRQGIGRVSHSSRSAQRCASPQKARTHLLEQSSLSSSFPSSHSSPKVR